MQLIHETIIMDFAISTIRDYLFGSDCDRNRTRIAKEIVVCKDDWNEICKRTLTLAIVDRFELRSLFYESECDDLMAILLAAETTESAIIATAIDIFPNWEDILLPQLIPLIREAITRHWKTLPSAQSLRERLDREIEWLVGVETNPDNWEKIGQGLTSIELSARL